ncbi:MAG: chorismate synthase [Oscillospiraceae bacterium]|nr:chorismate synthase [Oscillospiraceae bacterium]MBQ6901578.1 chorismate synthase [Oscillospiraceae bacterium]
MASLTGDKLKISIFGESHSEAIGVLIDGFPAGFKLDTEKLLRFMARRAPGSGAHTTSRKESDLPEFVSGVVDGVTSGSPICAIIRNTNTRSKDYENLRDVPRPGHADYTAYVKYGMAHDIRGGGHFSGRLTAPLCIAGGICMQYLEEKGIKIAAHVAEIAGVCDKLFDGVNPELDLVLSDAPIAVLDPSSGERMMAEILRAKEELDSVGGIVECAATGVPAGLGEPMFDGVENRIARIVFGIPAVKGIEFGAGFGACRMRGSENNDAFCISGGDVATQTNNHGGSLGGITSGMPIIFRAGIKPTPSIARTQKSVSLSQMCETTLEIKGRHDPCIVPRAVACMEAAMAVAVCDMML